MPASTDTRVFHESVAGGKVRFIKVRLKFQQIGKEQDAAPSPSMVCVMGLKVKANMRTVSKEQLAK
ncbi:hypothetical protein [Pseudoalteromonas sp. SG43-3]|uniref:hypothetical protein n=1 Tax=Pseudoalteromonas sp. SG43-3 TaxID=2760970 RepID=UPI001C71D185|nr:hypothetical protein [Pseudoalteromonas sp. SG43-3]